MKRYERYKDSGVEWLGEVPEHWRILRGKWIFKKENRPVSISDEIVTCFRDGQVTLRSNRRTEGFTNALKEIGYQGVDKGDFVIHNMDAFAGAIGISDSKGKATPVYSVCTPFKDDIANPFYYSYLLRSFALNGLITSLAKGIRERSTDFRYSDFGSLEYFAPSIDEQNRIVAFLDERCAKIDKAIEQKVQMIELLNERRQIIIQRAVTRGLNPNVPLKDSDIDWIGQIPSHWQVKRLKSFCDFINRGCTPSYVEDETFKVVNQATFSKGYWDETNIRFTNNTDKKGKLYSNDVLLASTGGGVLGKVYLFSSKDDNYFADSHVTIIRDSKKRFIPSYLYLFVSVKYDLINGILSQGSTNQIELQRNCLTALWITYPPLSEQREIADYLDKVSTKTEQAIKLKCWEIEQLKEYKQTLINSAVTGKIKIE